MLYDPKIAHMDIRGFDVEGTTGKMGAKYKEAASQTKACNEQYRAPEVLLK